MELLLIDLFQEPGSAAAAATEAWGTGVAEGRANLSHQSWAYFPSTKKTEGRYSEEIDPGKHMARLRLHYEVKAWGSAFIDGEGRA